MHDPLRHSSYVVLDAPGTPQRSHTRDRRVDQFILGSEREPDLSRTHPVARVETARRDNRWVNEPSRHGLPSRARSSWNAAVQDLPRAAGLLRDAYAPLLHMQDRWRDRRRDRSRRRFADARADQLNVTRGEAATVCGGQRVDAQTGAVMRRAAARPQTRSGGRPTLHEACCPARLPGGRDHFELDVIYRPRERTEIGGDWLTLLYRLPYNGALSLETWWPRN